jgi:hypothetical protein
MALPALAGWNVTQRANESLTVAMVAKPTPQPPVTLLHRLSAQTYQLADLLPPQPLCPDRSQQLVPHPIYRLVRLVEHVERLTPPTPTLGAPAAFRFVSCGDHGRSDLMEQPNKVIKVIKCLPRVIQRQLLTIASRGRLPWRYGTRARYR